MPHFVEKNQQDHADLTNITYICSDVMNLAFKILPLILYFFTGSSCIEDAPIKILFERIHRWLKPQGELFFRESCRVKRIKNTDNGYYAHYRTLAEYDELVKNFTLVKEGHIQAYVHAFADPLQSYWHCKKN